jgi:predicted DNA-binding antitoxin AbrB/MazE fold protein
MSAQQVLMWGVTPMATVHAIYENGVFRPLEAVDLPERCQVEFDVRVVDPADRREAMQRVYEILGHRFNSGQHDLAERHNEHQP